MKDLLFKITGLKCAYDEGEVVLEIPELEIKKGELTIFLGKSGVGKSTVLETLALMNFTLSNNSKVMFFPDKNTQIDFSLLDDTNDEEVAKVRNDHFSFIFQDTNLMGNFTAYENLCLTQMLQGKSYEESLVKVKKALKDLELDISDSKKHFELSGGQKQRLAFVRAITPEFTVLFGDEPTGNLDPDTARSLMKNLNEKIKEENKTAILVSHDLQLALEFADNIVILTKKKDMGYLDNENVFCVVHETDGTKSWRNKKNEIIDQPYNMIAKKIRTV